MKNFKNKYRKGASSVCCGVVAALMALPLLTACEDFFAQESSDVLYADQEHLNLAEDSIYSVIGVMTKLQSLADRTILLGELRGDLVGLRIYARFLTSASVMTMSITVLATIMLSSTTVTILLPRPTPLYATTVAIIFS